MRKAAPYALLVMVAVAALAGWLSSWLIALGALAAAAWAGRALAPGQPVHPPHAAAGAPASAPPRTSVEGAPAPTVENREQEIRREFESGLAVARDATRASAAILWRLDRSVQMVRPVAAVGRALPQPRTLRGDPLDWVAREGTPMRIEPAPAWAPDGVTVTAARLWAREDRGWLITLELPLDANVNLDTLDFTAAPLRLLVQLQDSRFESDAERRRTATLIDILRRIPSEIEPEKFGLELLTACVGIAGGTGGALGRWDGDSGRILAVAGSDGGPVVGETFVSPTSELGLAARAGGPLIRPPGAWKPGDTQIGSANDRWTERPRTFVALPLQLPDGGAGRVAGVMVVWSTRDRELDAQGVEMFNAITPYAALHLEHAAQFGRMRETAESDGLTGLRNRRAFDSALQQESLRIGRTARPLSLLMIDLDHFKSVNDKYGHEAGDEVLRRVAAILRHSVREVDVAARFGGEEMAVLLPETPLKPAREIAERIRASIAEAVIDWKGQRIPVTVSIGLSSVPERVAAAVELVGNADEALYEAKRAGRNRVVG